MISRGPCDSSLLTTLLSTCRHNEIDTDPISGLYEFSNITCHDDLLGVRDAMYVEPHAHRLVLWQQVSSVLWGFQIHA